jgi:hypothetical protein
MNLKTLMPGSAFFSGISKEVILELVTACIFSAGESRA